MGEFVGVRAEGIGELRRGLQAIDRELPSKLQQAMEPAAQRTVLPAARSETPGSGRLAGSLTVGSGTSRGIPYVAIRSPLPYANVIHWGGTTGRGHKPGVAGSGSVKVKGSKFAVRAAEERLEQFAEQLGQAIDRFLADNGLR